MRNVLKANEIFHFWANQTQSTGKCSNVFFEDGILYSYGHHFQIARIVTKPDGGKITLFNDNTASTTTSKQQSYANRANWHQSLSIPVMPDRQTSDAALFGNGLPNWNKFCDGDCSLKDFMDKYKIRSIQKDRILIGCHEILMKEIELIAIKLNW